MGQPPSSYVSLTEEGFIQPVVTSLTVTVACSDGASTERWVDPEMRKAFQDILKGDWKNHDPFSMSGRLNGISNMHGRPNQVGVPYPGERKTRFTDGHIDVQTSMFRSWQGWLAMSNTGPGEGVSKVSICRHSRRLNRLSSSDPPRLP